MIISAQKGGVDRREVSIHDSLPQRHWFEADDADPELHIITWKGKPVLSRERSWATAKKAAGGGGARFHPMPYAQIVCDHSIAPGLWIRRQVQILLDTMCRLC